MRFYLKQWDSMSSLYSCLTRITCHTHRSTFGQELLWKAKRKLMVVDYSRAKPLGALSFSLKSGIGSTPSEKWLGQVASPWGSVRRYRMNQVQGHRNDFIQRDFRELSRYHINNYNKSHRTGRY